MPRKQLSAGAAAPLLTLDEAAHRLGIHRDTARKLIADGELRAINIAPAGRRRATFRIEPAAIEELIAARATAKKSSPAARSRGYSGKYY